MARHVYAITSGSYSDYTVHCIVMDEDDANKLLERLNGQPREYRDQYELERFYVASSDVQQTASLMMSVEIMDSGAVRNQREHPYIDWPWAHTHDVPCHWRWVRAPMYNGLGGRLEVAGTDLERVRKVFGEKKAAFFADEAMRDVRQQRDVEGDA